MPEVPVGDEVTEQPAHRLHLAALGSWRPGRAAPALHPIRPQHRAGTTRVVRWLEIGVLDHAVFGQLGCERHPGVRRCRAGEPLDLHVAEPRPEIVVHGNRAPFEIRRGTEKVVLLLEVHEGKDFLPEREPVIAVVRAGGSGGKAAVGIGVRVQSLADLLEIGAATRLPGGVASRLNRRQEQPDQHRDDHDHHQELHQRKAARPLPIHGNACPSWRGEC